MHTCHPITLCRRILRNILQCKQHQDMTTCSLHAKGGLHQRNYWLWHVSRCLKAAPQYNQPKNDTTMKYSPFLGNMYFVALVSGKFLLVFFVHANLKIICFTILTNKWWDLWTRAGHSIQCKHLGNRWNHAFLVKLFFISMIQNQNHCGKPVWNIAGSNSQKVF